MPLPQQGQGIGQAVGAIRDLGEAPQTGREILFLLGIWRSITVGSGRLHEAFNCSLKEPAGTLEGENMRTSY